MINAGGARGGQRESKGGRETERENIHGRVKYRGRHRHCRETDKQAIACENAAMGVVIVISTVQYSTVLVPVQYRTVMYRFSQYCNLRSRRSPRGGPGRSRGTCHTCRRKCVRGCHLPTEASTAGKAWPPCPCMPSAAWV